MEFFDNWAKSLNLIKFIIFLEQKRIDFIRIRRKEFV